MVRESELQAAPGLPMVLFLFMASGVSFLGRVE